MLRRPETSATVMSVAQLGVALAESDIISLATEVCRSRRACHFPNYYHKIPGFYCSKITKFRAFIALKSQNSMFLYVTSASVGANMHLRVNLDVATARVAVLYYTYLCGDALAHGVGVAYHAHLLALRRL